MTTSLEEAIERTTALNLDISEDEKQRQSTDESLYNEVRSKMEEAVGSFLVFLPHLKHQIDFAHRCGEIFQGGIYYPKGKEGKFNLYARGYAEESFLSRKNSYNLQVYFGFYKGGYVMDYTYYHPSIRLLIPSDVKKEKKMKVIFYEGGEIDYENKVKDKSFMKIRLAQLADVVVEGYKEASALNMPEVFSKDFGMRAATSREGRCIYKILLPYVLSAIPDLTIGAANLLSSSIKKRKETADGNSAKISGLKTPDLEEVVGLLNKLK